jgi:dephospho-CoA kinase
MLPQIIGIVGSIRSGKSTVSKYLESRYGYRIASNSEVVKDISIKLGMEPTRANLSRVGDAVFSSIGNDAIARFRVNNKREFPIVVDGIRYIEEVRAYRAECCWG